MPDYKNKRPQTEAEFEQLGYDSWIEYWCARNSSPTATDCPARYMPVSVQRSAVIRGWNRAKREANPNS